jgi:uncharacterized damage-inducible protein DinB
MIGIGIAMWLVAAQAQPQGAALDQTTTHGFAAGTYRSIKDFVLRSAEKMPAEHFTFRPAPEVRSYDLVLAHIADANYLLCSYALGEANPNGEMQRIEKAKLPRADVTAKLKESFAYCDRAYEGLTEARAGDQVGFFGGQKRSRGGVLWFHVSHAFEHYGNLVTYMRIKGIVPPSSEPAGTPR